MKGEYPRSMLRIAGNKMPSFSIEQRKRVKGSFDFLGVNYYSTLLVADIPSDNSSTYNADFMKDLSVKLIGRPDSDAHHLFI